MDEELRERTENEMRMMKKVFDTLGTKQENQVAVAFFDMASNYFKDGGFFLQKKDYIRAFEALTISWSYIDAGIKAGFFSVGADLEKYFTNG